MSERDDSKKTRSDAADLKKDLSSLWKNTIDQFDEIKNAIVRSGEVGKSKLDATFLNRQRDKLFTDLGRMVFEASKGGEESPLSFDDDMNKKMRRIVELEKEIDEAESQVQSYFESDDEATTDL